MWNHEVLARLQAPRSPHVARFLPVLFARVHSAQRRECCPIGWGTLADGNDQAACSRNLREVVEAVASFKCVSLTPARTFILSIEIDIVRPHPTDCVREAKFFVKKTRKAAFDPRILFANVWRRNAYRNFSRVTLRTFYIQKVKIELTVTVVSERGKEAVIGAPEPTPFLARDVPTAFRCVS